DLDAVEGSINDGEVFRFLTKPCAPQHLRDTVALAARLARSAPSAPASDPPMLPDAEALEILDDERVFAAPLAPPKTDTAFTSTAVLSDDQKPGGARAGSAATTTATAAKPTGLAPGLGVLVFTSDDAMIETVQQAVRAR